MSMTMTAPVQAQTSTQPRTGQGGGGGIRNLIKARTGGNGDGHRFNEARTGSSPASGVDYKHEKPINKHQRDMDAEEASQHLNAWIVDSVKMQAAIAKEGVQTQDNTLSEQKQKTENARLKTMLAQGQGRRIKANIGLTAIQLIGDQIKTQGAQQSNQISAARNQVQHGLGMATLQAMNLQLSAATTQNSNTQELMQLQGLMGGRITNGNRTPVRNSLSSGGLGLPSTREFGFGQNGFRRPWSR